MIPLPLSFDEADAHGMLDAVTTCLRTHVGAGLPVQHETDVARAIVSYCETHCDGRLLSANALSLLAARALVTIGEVAAGRDLVQRAFGAAVAEDVVVSVVTGPVCSPLFVRALSSGLLVPMSWETSGEGITWVLDFDRLVIDPGSAFDLHIVTALNRIVASVAPVWDVASGRGTLGWRGELAAPGWDGPTRVTRVLQEALSSVAGGRSWGSVPTVIRLVAAG